MRPPVLDDCLTRLHHVLCDLPPDVREGIEQIVSEMVSAWLCDRNIAYGMARESIRVQGELNRMKSLLELALVRGLPLLPPRFLVRGEDWLPVMKQTRLPENGIAALLERKAS